MSPHAASSDDINSFSGTIINKKGHRLFCKYWEPKESPKALVFIAHGYAEHCLPYEPLARTLALNNFYVISHDHAGHGQSQGRRVFITTFQDFVDDIFKHLDMIRKKHPNLDCFICGHSMGGAISVLSASRKPDYFKGVILIGPAIATNPELVSPLKVTLAKIMRWMAPKFPVGSMDMSLVCSDPQVVKKMKEDPLRFHGFCTAGLGASLLDSCEEIQAKASTISFPFLLLQGEEDKICIPEGALLMYEKSPSKDKTLKMYPKAYHNLLYEPNGIAEQVTSDIVEWLLARV